jgi:hypothetical protein
VFDSSFDEVQKVGCLELDDTQRLLRNRVVGLPQQFACLCHVLGGGLPREVIRTARQVCGYEKGQTLELITEQLCRRQLAYKIDAAKIAMRRIKDPHYVVELSRWLTTLQLAGVSEETVLDVCRRFRVDFIGLLEQPREGDPERAKEFREALSIGTEMVTFAYFVVTVRAVFRELQDEEATQAAIDGGELNMLAQARQAFSANLPEAWDLIAGVRGMQTGERLPFPDAHYPAREEQTLA